MSRSPINEPPFVITHKNGRFQVSLTGMAIGESHPSEEEAQKVIESLKVFGQAKKILRFIDPPIFVFEEEGKFVIYCGVHLVDVFVPTLESAVLTAGALMDYWRERSPMEKIPEEINKILKRMPSAAFSQQEERPETASATKKEDRGPSPMSI